MVERRSAGNEQDVGSALEQPGERRLHRRGAEPSGGIGQLRRLQRREAAERKERHISDAVAAEIVDQRVVVAMRDIVVVLHADDVRDGARLRDLPGRHVAEADMTDEPLALELGQGGERRLDRALGRPVDVEHEAQIDDIERVDAEVAQIVMDRARKLGGRHRKVPRRVRAAPRADLGDDDEIVGIGMERFANELIGDVRAVVVARINMIDPARNRLAQHRDRAVAVLRRPEHAGSCELHRAIAEPLHDAVAKLERSGFADVDHGLSPLDRPCM
jgi:hypothetical protein